MSECHADSSAYAHSQCMVLLLFVLALSLVLQHTDSVPHARYPYNVHIVQDYFTICMFDHEMSWCSGLIGGVPELLPVNQSTIAYASQWVMGMQARGTTDIMTPYQVACEALLRPRVVAGQAPASYPMGGHKVRRVCAVSVPTLCFFELQRVIFYFAKVLM